VQLGLTATPKRKINVDTYAYFGEPVFIYSLKEGINDGFLTPFKVKQIATTLDDYTYTPDDAVVEGEVEAGKRYDRKRLQPIIEIGSARRYRVKLFMGMIDQREKTLVFCATQAHALLVRDLINQIKTSSDPNYCQRVTANDGALGEQHLRDFQDNEKTIPTDPDHLAEALHRRGCPQRAQHRADAAHQFDDRVQADHRARHAALRRQGLLHDLRLREGPPPLQRSGVGWRAPWTPEPTGNGRRRREARYRPRSTTSSRASWISCSRSTSRKASTN
jgi:hypothetical protein